MSHKSLTIRQDRPGQNQQLQQEPSRTPSSALEWEIISVASTTIHHSGTVTGGIDQVTLKHSPTASRTVPRCPLSHHSSHLPGHTETDTDQHQLHSTTASTGVRDTTCYENTGRDLLSHARRIIISRPFVSSLPCPSHQPLTKALGLRSFEGRQPSFSPTSTPTLRLFARVRVAEYS